MRYGHNQPIEKERANKLMNLLMERSFEAEKINNKIVRFQTKDALIDFQEWDDYYYVVIEFDITLDNVLKYLFEIDVNQ